MTTLPQFKIIADLNSGPYQMPDREVGGGRTRKQAEAAVERLKLKLGSTYSNYRIVPWGWGE